jgi:O-antigen ligase
MLQKQVPKTLDHILFGIFVIFFISIVCSLRAVTSISIGLLILINLARSRFETMIFKKNLTGSFLVGCLLLFVSQCFSLLYTTDIEAGLRHLRISSGLVLIPFAVWSGRSFFSWERFQQLMYCYIIVLFFASIYCLAIALIHYFSGAPSSVLFYHPLVKPLSQHAIQFSILVFIALLFLFNSIKTKETRSFVLTWILISFFTLFLILLSSKLVIIWYILYLLYFSLESSMRKVKRIRSILFISILLVLATIVCSTRNPVGNRFRELFSGNKELFAQKKFNQGIYFNGLQFRLLEWRFVYEILSEKHAWIQGLTPGDGQAALDRKYIETDMYQGNGGDDRGYLGYHTHNQYLQCLLQTGIIGLLLFLFICYSLLRMALHSRSREFMFFVILLLVYNFTDAILETQYGVVIFSFFPVFLYFGSGARSQLRS